MAKYLLACECGANVEVETAQAGNQVECVCGAMLDVPPFRQLSQLPRVAEEPPQVESTWSARQGLLTASIIIAALFGSAGTYYLATMPELEKYDPEVHLGQVDAVLEQLPPAAAWEFWRDRYRGLDKVGFAEFRPHNAGTVQYQRQQQRVSTTIAYSLAAVAALVAVVTFLWPGRR